MTTSLTDDQIFRGAVIALSDLRRIADDHPKYGAYRAAATAWVNEAQERLSAAAVVMNTPQQAGQEIQ